MEPPRSRLKAILTRRCPRCLEGAVYQKILKPNAACPECGLLFEREPGYFLGSFYVSYGFGAAVAIPTVIVALYLDLPFLWMFPIVAIWVGLFGPLIVTYSRVVWYHLDQVVHFGLGDVDRCLDRPEEVVDEKPALVLVTAWLHVDPFWDSLRDHPRFQTVVGRMNFPN